MTRRELELIKQRYPVSEAVIKRSLDAETELPSSVPQCRVQENALVESEGKEAGASGTRLRVAVTSFRCRLTDLDNLCPKWLIDALRYRGLISDDSPEHIVLEVRQRKVAHKSEEGTLIEIWHI